MYKYNDEVTVMRDDHDLGLGVQWHSTEYGDRITVVTQLCVNEQWSCSADCSVRSESRCSPLQFQQSRILRLNTEQAEQPEVVAPLLRNGPGWCEHAHKMTITISNAAALAPEPAAPFLALAALVAFLASRALHQYARTRPESECPAILNSQCGGGACPLPPSTSLRR